VLTSPMDRTLRATPDRVRSVDAVKDKAHEVVEYSGIALVQWIAAIAFTDRPHARFTFPLS